MNTVTSSPQQKTSLSLSSLSGRDGGLKDSLEVVRLLITSYTTVSRDPLQESAVDPGKLLQSLSEDSKKMSPQADSEAVFYSQECYRRQE
ncbi:hypothetical protein TNCT_412061 [Trichonephila clavata]|uniref:Uncharacterized protein n=1 Tax=Trichonephila clavata TaxID=2740835 RepID=A0A8X6HXA5_TRICU|nr:hypothetical protein TNCT_412061 [Trichonephila clavata]